MQQNNHQLKFKRFRFENLPGLDPVTLYVEQFGQGVRATIQDHRGVWVLNNTADYDGILWLADSPLWFLHIYSDGGLFIKDANDEFDENEAYLKKIWAPVQPLLRAYCETTTAENRWDCTYES